MVTTQHRQGNLNENSISIYARSHKIEEVTIGLSLLCSLPGDVIERALLDRNRETLLILAKALEFSWATTMALLFLGAKDHRITAQELKDLEREFGRLNIETSRSVLKFYQSRKNAGDAAADAEAPAGASPCSDDDRSETAGKISAMNASHSVLPQASGIGSDQVRSRTKPLDAAWIVLEAANDLGDHATVEICRRVIDAGLNGAPASPSDLHVIIEYFR